MKQKIKVKIASVLAVFGVVLFFSQCSNNVTTQKLAEGVDLSNYKTYAWLPAGDTLNNDFSKDSTVAAIIRGEVNEELQEDGYKLDPENPDFLVLVHTNYTETIELETYPASYSYYGPGFYTGPWYGGYYPYYNNISYIDGTYVEAVDYTKGTLVIDLIDTKKEQVIWRGKATDKEYDQTNIQAEMEEKVDDILDELPS